MLTGYRSTRRTNVPGRCPEGAHGTARTDVQSETSYSPECFTPQVYQQVMSGKPRFSGAHAVLEYFGVPDAETRSMTSTSRLLVNARLTKRGA
jgi:hypothetical protein